MESAAHGAWRAEGGAVGVAVFESAESGTVLGTGTGSGSGSGTGVA